MTLEEAKDIIKELYRSTKFGDSKVRLALFAIIYYIENESIPKEKVENKIKSIDDETIYLSWTNKGTREWCKRKLQELLGDDK